MTIFQITIVSCLIVLAAAISLAFAYFAGGIERDSRGKAPTTQTKKTQNHENLEQN